MQRDPGAALFIARRAAAAQNAVAGIVAATSFALAMLSASLDHVNAQTTPGPVSSPPADELAPAFRAPAGNIGSRAVHQHHVFRTLLHRFALTAPAVAVCDLSMRSGDRFDAIRLIVNPPRPEQRANCLRQIVRFALQGEIGEAEFFVARQEEARNIVTWITPSARYPRCGVRERAPRLSRDLS